MYLLCLINVYGISVSQCEMLSSTWMCQVMVGNSVELCERVTFEPCHNIFMDCGVHLIVKLSLFIDLL
jgi:hypothetical protein